MAGFLFINTGQQPHQNSYNSYNSTKKCGSLKLGPIPYLQILLTPADGSQPSTTTSAAKCGIFIPNSAHRKIFNRYKMLASTSTITDSRRSIVLISSCVCRSFSFQISSSHFLDPCPLFSNLSKNQVCYIILILKVTSYGGFLVQDF